MSANWQWRESCHFAIRLCSRITWRILANPGEARRSPVNNQRNKPTGAFSADQRQQSKSVWWLPLLNLMQRGARGMLQTLDLVLDHQLAALEFDNLQIVC
jgi:hypothetical protein